MVFMERQIRQNSDPPKQTDRFSHAIELRPFDHGLAINRQA